MDPVLIVAIVVVVLVVVVLIRSVKVIPQAQAAVIERLGRFNKASSAGLVWLVPFLDRIRARIDLREQVVSFPPQPVITEDNLTVSIDTVVYFQVTDPRAAVYEIANYIVAVEQLTTTTLRNVVGGMNLEQTLTSRDSINGQLRGVLDEATGKWGIRVARVELKAIDPPPSIQEAMEKQMRADRDKRAMILNSEGLRESSIKTAEGQKQAAVLTAEGAKQSAILAAEGERQSRILRAQGERAARYLQAQGQAKAIEKVFAAVKAGKPTPELLAYQYLQTLPQMAQGDANKVWMIPSDFSKSLRGLRPDAGHQGRRRGVPVRAARKMNRPMPTSPATARGHRRRRRRLVRGHVGRRGGGRGAAGGTRGDGHHRAAGRGQDGGLPEPRRRTAGGSRAARGAAAAARSGPAAGSAAAAAGQLPDPGLSRPGRVGRSAAARLSAAGRSAAAGPPRPDAAATGIPVPAARARPTGSPGSATLTGDRPASRNRWRLSGAGGWARRSWPRCGPRECPGLRAARPRLPRGG